MLTRVAEAIAAARAVVAVTGAGISAESGVPTFRGAGGLWKRFRPEQLATPEAFARDPDLVWEWYRWRRAMIAAARPNAGHEMLARLEARVPRFTLLTQNVDGLHRLAGSRNVLELHGNIWRSRCSAEPDRGFDDRSSRGQAEEAASDASPAAAPRCPSCGARLRPDVVWFGEPLDTRVLEAAMAAARDADLVLVIGTSAVVYPVAALPSIARAAGARVVEVNVEDTPLTSEADFVLRGPSAIVLPALERLL
jgi:NAD-dependent deacetylase